MLSHYLAVALRNARRAPVAAAMNVLTLGLGLACFLCAYGFVAYLEQAERAFPNADRIYVLTTSFARVDGSFARAGLVQTPEAAAELIEIDFPELVTVARALPLEGLTSVAVDASALRLAAAAADPAFLEVFALPFAAGDPRTALREPGSVVLTRDAAVRLFGADSALGRPLVLASDIAATVTGIIESVPEPSHMGRTEGAPLRFDMLVSTDVRNAIQAAMYDPRVVEFQRQGWAGGSAITYLLLSDDPAVSAGDLERRFGDFVTRRVPETQRATMDVTFGLLPVRDLLRTSVDAELFSADFGVSVSSVLLTLGALVLAIACVNYANLATARAARRLREVGLRKALGAAPAQIALQHLLEAAMLTVAALAGALLLLRAALPALETMSGMSLGAVLFDGPRIWLFATAVGAAATLAAGMYPALAMARVGPIAALRAALAPLGAKRLAAVLVGVQFAAASLLVIAVTVIALQNDRLVETGLGAVTDPLVLIENQSRVTNVDARTLRAELSHLPQVKGVTEAGGLPWQRLVAITFLRAEPDESALLHRVLVRSVGYDFFAVLGIELLAGRVFDAARGDDARREPQAADAPRTPTPIVVDRTFVEQFGLGSPEEAIGRSIYSLSAAGEGAAPQQIVGVVENRRLTFRGAGAEAVVYGLTAEPAVTYVRVAASEIGAALEGIDRVWSRLAPNVAISRQFFDEAFNQAYERFARLNQVFGALSLIALAIATAGLVGMATLVAGQRRREIGVRKTLGASAARMVRMLLGTFLRPVIIANAIVWPLAYLAAREYLAAFLDPVPLNALPFVLAFGVTLLIAALASGVQTIRAARSKPADVLRNE